MPSVAYDFGLSKTLPDGVRLQYLRDSIEASSSKWPAGTTLDFEFLESVGFDADLLARLRDGIKLPLVNENVPVVQLPNHPSLRECSKHASEEWSRLERLGKVRFLGRTKPHDVFIIPIAGIIKPRQGLENEPDLTFLQRFKLRLIIDLKRGKVNEYVQYARRKLQFGTLEAVVNKMTKSCWCFILDLADCFFNIPIHQSSQRLLGFFDEVRQEYGVYTHCPFGLECGPQLNDDLVKELLRCFVVWSNGAFPGLVDSAPVDFVDDLFDCSGSKSKCWLKLEALAYFFLRCGVRPSTKKSGLVPPSQKVTYVGWIISSIAMIAEVPDDKAQKGIKLGQEILEANAAGSLRMNLLMSGMGFFNHIAQLIVQGRRQLGELWAIVNSTGIHDCWRKGKHPNPLVKLSDEAVRECQWWMSTLTSPPALQRRFVSLQNGATLWTAKSPDFQAIEEILKSPPADVRVFESDAAKTKGWGYWSCSEEYVRNGMWGDALPQDKPSFDDEINLKELWCMVHLVETESQRWRDEGVLRVMIRCDNEAACLAVNRRFSKSSKQMNVLCQRLDSLEANGQFLVIAKWIPGINNPVADAASRQKLFADDFNKDPLKDVFLSPKLFKMIQERYIHAAKKKLAIDAFATSENAQLPDFYSPERSAFIQQIDADTPVYAFPPPAIAHKWLEHVVRNGLQGAIVLVMNPKMWNKNVTRWIENRFLRFCCFDAGSRPFRTLISGGRHQSLRTHHEIWVVRPRK